MSRSLFTFLIYCTRQTIMVSINFLDTVGDTSTDTSLTFILPNCLHKEPLQKPGNLSCLHIALATYGQIYSKRP